MANNFAGKSIAGIHEQEGAIAVEPVRLFYLSVKLTIPVNTMMRAVLNSAQIVIIASTPLI